MNPADLYEKLILEIGNGTGASDSLLHVHAGLAVLLNCSDHNPQVACNADPRFSWSALQS